MADGESRPPPSALQVDEVLEQIAKDDQEEWEYEYSNTETETFYLTLDLSHPDFKERREKVVNYSRSGYYKSKSMTQTFKEPARPDNRHQDDGHADDDDEGMAEAEDAEDANVRARAKGKGVDRGSPPREPDEAADRDNRETLDDIQILDLHSHNPIIAYRGRIFEGDWAEVVGTEAILTRRGPYDAPLPALRHLADDIDLLAASASKIVTREKVIKPTLDSEAVERAASLDAVKKEWSIRIPLGKRDKEGEKGEQARFLENLMAVKKKKGEKDGVTVYARPAGEEGVAVRPVRPRARARGAAEARERRPKRSRNRRTGPGWNRGGVGTDVVATGGGGDDLEGGEGGSRPSLSTPTPLRWDDLMTPTGRESNVDATRRAGDGEARGTEGNEEEDVKMSG